MKYMKKKELNSLKQTDSKKLCNKTRMMIIMIRIKKVIKKNIVFIQMTVLKI
jgi:hypothetical protein